MPSSWSPSLRFELQFTGENVNLWGERLNGALQRADSAIAGWSTVPLGGDYVLSTANGAADEARSAMLKFTGAGGCKVTVPSVSKQYLVWNACTGPVTLTTGAGASVIVDSGDRICVLSDGAGVYELGYGGQGLKAYVASAALSATGALPGAAGHEGKALVVREGAWAPGYLKTSDIQDFEETQRARALVYSLIFS